MSADYNWQDLQQAVPCAQLNLGGEVALVPANFAVFVLYPDHVCASMRVCSIAGMSLGSVIAGSPGFWISCVQYSIIALVQATLFEAQK